MKPVPTVLLGCSARVLSVAVNPGDSGEVSGEVSRTTPDESSPRLDSSEVSTKSLRCLTRKSASLVVRAGGRGLAMGLSMSEHRAVTPDLIGGTCAAQGITGSRGFSAVQPTSRISVPSIGSELLPPIAWLASTCEVSGSMISLRVSFPAL